MSPELKAARQADAVSLLAYIEMDRQRDRERRGVESNRAYPVPNQADAAR